jgi:hypothetical protein
MPVDALGRKPYFRQHPDVIIHILEVFVVSEGWIFI